MTEQGRSEEVAGTFDPSTEAPPTRTIGTQGRAGGGEDMNSIAWFEQLTIADTEVAGGKGANLGELTRASFPVPPGFVVTASAYLDAMTRGSVRQVLAAKMRGASDGADVGSLSRDLQAIVEGAVDRAALRELLLEPYSQLAQRVAEVNPKVAVRSSATAEDSAGASFAGMNRTFTNIAGIDDLVDAVARCWVSLFGERSVSYRISQAMPDEPAIAVVVQIMVEADQSGVAFTADPVSGNRSLVVVEAGLGQGEVVVGGAIEPDTYVVSREPLRVISAHIGIKSHKIVASEHGDRTVALAESEQQARILNDDAVLSIARLALNVEDHYGVPQDTEWCFGPDHRLYLLQARPITTLVSPAAPPNGAPAPVPVAANSRGTAVEGLGAAPGIVTGVVRVLTSPAQGSELVTGEVLVAPMTDPDWFPTLRRACAVVTDSGGVTCHAAITSRELGVPCVVGTHDATKRLHTGQLVTVDGARGVVREGGTITEVPGDAAHAALPGTGATTNGSASGSLRGIERGPVTATRLYVNLALAERAEHVAAMPVDGVGLLRAELLTTEALNGRHPRHVMATEGAAGFVQQMAESVSKIASAFAPRPVVYRTIDFRSNEFRQLEGGDQYEAEERNPMIGYRGCYRYVKEPDLFALELQMLAQVRERYPNVGLMIPFVRTAWELEACLELVDASPLGRQRGLERWVMAEVPSVVYRLGDYAAMGITGVSIGSNDLTQLILGVDRDSEICSELFNEEDEAVLDAIGRIISECHRLGLTSSLCGQAPSNRPRFAEALVRFGIDSVSVTPDAAVATRRLLASAEQRIVLANSLRR
jgi:pyruvate, water dikinase